MYQGHLFLFVIASFPLFCCFALRFFRNYEWFYNFAYRLFPILFLINLVEAASYFSKDLYQFKILEAMKDVSLAIYVDKISILFLFILGFIWLIFAFYSSRYFKLLFENNLEDNSLPVLSYLGMQEFFIIIISLLNLIILSQNLFTILFFYICLIISSHLFGIKYLHLIETKFTKFFTFLLHLESFLILIATALTFKINRQIEFIDKIILPANYNELYYGVIFLLFFFGLFLATITPFYLFFKNIKFSSPILLVLFLMSYAFPSSFMFLKIVNYIYGIKGFELLFKKYSLMFFEIIILVNLIISAWKYLRERDLKSSLFYLFINQFSVLILSILIHLSNKFNYVFIALFAFIINFILLFLCSANFELYLKKFHEKNLAGIFYKMPITAVFFLFALLAIIGLAPTIASLDKFILIVFLIKNKLYISLSIYLLNFLFLLMFFYKYFKIIFNKNDFAMNGGESFVIKAQDNDENRQKINNIDQDSSLILTILFVAICSFISLVFSPYLINQL